MIKSIINTSHYLNHPVFYSHSFSLSYAPHRSDGYKDGTRNTMSSSNQTTPYNTLSRPISAQGYDDNTISAGRVPSRMDRDRGNYSGYGGSRTDVDGYLSMKQSNPALFDQSQYPVCSYFMLIDANLYCSSFDVLMYPLTCSIITNCFYDFLFVDFLKFIYA